MTRNPSPLGRDLLDEHVDRLAAALPALRASCDTLARWGAALANGLTSGGRLLAAGNGGSAAEAQHLTAELVGRFEGERRPLPAIALHGDTSAITAIGNDYGYEEVFARQVRAHARPGDVLLLLSTSGRSRNLLDRGPRGAPLWGRRLGAHRAPGPTRSPCCATTRSAFPATPRRCRRPTSPPSTCCAAPWRRRWRRS